MQKSSGDCFLSLIIKTYGTDYTKKFIGSTNCLTLMALRALISPHRALVQRA